MEDTRTMAKQAKAKTNAMRVLDARHIAYSTFTYPDTIHSAGEVATLLGVDADEVYKTLVVLTDDGRRLLVMTPGDRELDMRLVAKGAGANSARMALQRDAERLTGLKVGGISPLALLDKRFEMYIDRAALALDALYINGGQRGINLRVRVADLLDVTRAHPIEATRPADASA